nr:MAG TPA: hypothetical protein [Caudoviricetes sp.]
MQKCLKELIIKLELLEINTPIKPLWHNALRRV